MNTEQISYEQEIFCKPVNQIARINNRVIVFVFVETFENY